MWALCHTKLPKMVLEEITSVLFTQTSILLCMYTRKHLIGKNWIWPGSVHLSEVHPSFLQVTAPPSQGNEEKKLLCPYSSQQLTAKPPLVAPCTCSASGMWRICPNPIPSCPLQLCHSETENGAELFHPTKKYFLWGLRELLALPAKAFKELGKGRTGSLPSVRWVWWAEQPILPTSLSDVCKWMWRKSAAVRRAEGVRESGQKH